MMARGFVFPNNDWAPFLEKESCKDYFVAMREKVLAEYAQKTVFPPFEQIFNAFEYCPYAETKVVIIGQDPYIRHGQAHGLSFSVLCDRLPPSLQNIYKELSSDLGVQRPTSGNLTSWAKQGVLLLNSSLTVPQAVSNAHKDIGWYYLTANVVAHLNYAPNRIVYILWGRFAQGYQQFIDTDRHACLLSAHPSPMSAYNGFFGSRPFSKTNATLAEFGRAPIDWASVL